MKMLKNKSIATILMVIVAVFAPLMYSLFFMQSVWDPYGGAKNLPIAVVNKDEPAKYQGKVLNVGQQTVNQLKHNHQLKWEFVSADNAEAGMHNHKYYTVVTIPSDFSANAATVMSKHPRKMQLKYETNDSKNYLATSISELGMGKVNNQIRSAVTKAYATAMFDQLHLLGKGMKTASNGAQQINNGMITLANGANRYFAGVSKVNDGVQQLKFGVAPLAAGAQQLFNGSQALFNGLGQYTGGVGQLATGLFTLESNSGALGSGASQLHSGLDQISSQSAKLQNGARQLSAGNQQLNQRISGMIPQIQGQMNQMSGNVAQKGAALSSALQPLAATGNQLSSLSAKLNQINAGLGQLKTALANAGNANNGTNQLSSAAGTLSSIDTSHLSDQDKAKLQAVTGALRQAGAGNSASSALAPALQNIERLQAGVSQLKSAVDTSATNAQANTANIVRAANDLQNSLQSMQNQSGTMISGLSGQLTTATQQLAGGAKQVNAGVEQYANAVGQAASGAATLDNGVHQFTNGVGQAASGAGQLTAKSGQLMSGTGQLTGALGQLNGKVPALVGGVNQLAAGTQQLVDNSPALTQGIVKLNAGAGELAEKLGQGADKVNGIKTNGKTAGMFGTPTKLAHTSYSKVPNYGHALAPFIMATGLFIGVLVFTLEFPSSRVLETKEGRGWMLLHEFKIAIITSFFMVLIQNLVLMMSGLHVDHLLELFMVGFAFTLAMMAIMQFLTMAFGRFGVIFGLLLFVAQLGGAGGMFPMEVTNKFFNVIHPFLPMSYAIDGFRQAITGGFSTGFVRMNVLVLAVIAIVFYACLLWLAGVRKVRLIANKKVVEE